MGQPQHQGHGGEQVRAMQSGMQDDLLHECAGFVKQLGTRPSILPCCGYSLHEPELESVRPHRAACCN